MTAATVVVWRHGRTSWNSTGRFQGQADIGLDEVGRAQALAAAPALAALGPSRIVASDLVRAQQTAAPLAALTGLEVALDPRLREIHVGSWEGLVYDEVAVVDPVLAERYRRGEDVRRSATGETVGEVAERVATALAEHAEAAEDGSTLVLVMHGLAGRVGVLRFLGFPEETWRLVAGMLNCGWVTLERHHGGEHWRLREYNARLVPSAAPPIS